jgi:hypothetical protein
LLPEVERDPEAVVYNDVAGHPRYACGRDLLREGEVASERVGRREPNIAQGVGRGGIEVRDRAGAVGLRPASHREVARSAKDESAMPHTACTDLTLAVDRGYRGRRCAHGVPELTDGADLPDRTDEAIVCGSEMDEPCAGIEIHDAESPARVLVQWLVEARLDVRGEVRVAACVAASAEAEGGGHEE